MSKQIPRPQGQASLVVETIYALAAFPERWDQIIDVLGYPVPDTPVLPVPEPAAPGPVGVVVLGARGRVCAWNAAGEAVFLHRLGMVEPAGRAFFNPANHEALDRARARLRAVSERQVIVRFADASDEGPQFAYVMAADQLPPHLGAGLVVRGDFAEGAVAVVFPAVDATDRLWASLRASFGLTPAETRLAARLKDGLTLKEASSELGVSFNTVRNQLRAIFDKVGLSRQSDLVRALTQLSALAGVLGADGSSGALTPPISATEHGAVDAAPPIRRLILPDGRNLAWREYGDPAGAPVLVMHQGLGCSVLPRGSDVLGRDLGLRLICPERPGAGRSDPRPDYSVAGVADDIEILCRRLNLQAVQIAAFMSGASFALALAGRLGTSVWRILLASARPPGSVDETPRDLAHRGVLFRRRLFRNSGLADLVFSLMRINLSPSQIEKFVRAAASAPSDAVYLRTHPGVLAFITDSISESLAMTHRGIADEVRFASRHPAAPLDGVTAPITLWHGADDLLSSVDDVSHWLGGREASARVFADVGHFLPHKHWPDVLAWLAAG